MSKNSSGRPLKDSNRMHLALIVVMNALLLYTVAQAGTISIAGLKSLFTESSNLLPVGFALIAATVANGLLSANMKARLVFLRWRYTLPGHRAFSKYAVSDPRVDIAKLKKAWGLKGTAQIVAEALFRCSEVCNENEGVVCACLQVAKPE